MIDWNYRGERRPLSKIASPYPTIPFGASLRCSLISDGSQESQTFIQTGVLWRTSELSASNIRSHTTDKLQLFFNNNSAKYLYLLTADRNLSPIIFFSSFTNPCELKWEYGTGHILTVRSKKITLLIYCHIQTSSINLICLLVYMSSKWRVFWIVFLLIANIACSWG